MSTHFVRMFKFKCVNPADFLSRWGGGGLYYESNVLDIKWLTLGSSENLMFRRLPVNEEELRKNFPHIKVSFCNPTLKM